MSLIPETAFPRYAFLVVGGSAETPWAITLKQALSPVGDVFLVPAPDAIRLLQERRYDVVIIDAGAVRNAARLVSDMLRQQPGARIIVATASPTWMEAREVLRSGAYDYIRKSLDENALRSAILAALGKTSDFS